jgi:hypothetical protein
VAIDLIVIGVILVCGALGAVLLMRSMRRWTPTKGSSPESKEAEARLWQTRSMDQR